MELTARPLESGRLLVLVSLSSEESGALTLGGLELPQPSCWQNLTCGQLAEQKHGVQ